MKNVHIKNVVCVGVLSRFLTFRVDLKSKSFVIHNTRRKASYLNAGNKSVMDNFRKYR